MRNSAPISGRRRTTATAAKRRNSRKTSSPQPPQKRFTQKDEINLLTCLLHPTTNPFPNPNFSVFQIAAKLRRLKLKYQKLAKTQSSIKTPHDRKIHDMGREIWGENTGILPPKPTAGDWKRMGSEGGEEIINWSDFPFLIKQISSAFPETVELYKEGLRGSGLQIIKGMNEEWMKMELEEAEIMAKRAQLCVKHLKYMRDASKKRV